MNDRTPEEIRADLMTMQVKAIRTIGPTYQLSVAAGVVAGEISCCCLTSPMTEKEMDVPAQAIVEYETINEELPYCVIIYTIDAAHPEVVTSQVLSDLMGVSSLPCPGCFNELLMGQRTITNQDIA